MELPQCCAELAQARVTRVGCVGVREGSARRREGELWMNPTLTESGPGGAAILSTGWTTPVDMGWWRAGEQSLNRRCRERIGRLKACAPR